MRLKAKVYTDQNDKKFMVALGVFKEESQRVHTFLMSDDVTIEKLLTVEEWNALPFYYFKEDGEAPRHKSWVPKPLEGP